MSLNKAWTFRYFAFVAFIKKFFSPVKLEYTALPVEPLMPREVIPDFVGLSFEEYLEQRFVSPFLSIIQERSPHTAYETAFNDKIQYLLDTVEDVSTKRSDIIGLWTLLFAIIEEEEPNDTDMESLYGLYIPALLSLTIEADFPQEAKENIDKQLNEAIEEYLNRLLSSEEDIVTKFRAVNFWQVKRSEILWYLKLGAPYGDIAYLIRVMEQNNKDLESLKTLSPLTFMNFIEAFKHSYKRIRDGYKLKYRATYLKRCLEQIVVARNAGLFDDYQQLLEDYYAEKLSNSGFANWFLKWFTGYGERPWNLAFFFLFINVVFAGIFMAPGFDFNFPSPEPQGFNRFLSFISFNNTSMLTVGYGDIYPKGIGTKLFVLVLQIVGFAISGSAIALFLRKLFRF